MDGVFRFHNVGQGLFYSGILSKREENSHKFFSFVYDCGTESDKLFLRREIDDYKLLLPPKGTDKHKKLNLLVISHLHDDHVNGLEYLLQDTEVDTVVMPYTNDGLKLLARLESDSDDEFLQVFYTDPIAWFVSHGVHRILLIGSEEIIEGQDDSSNNQFRTNEDIQVESIAQIDYIGKTEIAYLRNKAQVSCSNFCWEFHFENLQLESSKVNSYMQIVEDFKQKKGCTLEQIFKCKECLGDLRKQVKIEFPSGYLLNRTSVVLLHKPTLPARVTLCHLCHLKKCTKYAKYLTLLSNHVYNTTILTGDIELNKNEQLEILNQYDEDHKHYLLQYPHHGSRKNNIKYFIGLGAKVNVLSYGMKNKYGHPHCDVLKQLPDIVLVNEIEDFNYKIMVNDLKDAENTKTENQPQV